MPDGTVVENRDQRFAQNLQVAREYVSEHGHLRPDKGERPGGMNLYQWLKNQELRLRKGTMPPERRQALESLPGWTERVSRSGGGQSNPLWTGPDPTERDGDQPNEATPK